MGQSRRVFTREFKQEAVKLVTVGGHPTAQVARDLGITPNLLRRWKQEVTGDLLAAFPGKGPRTSPSRRHEVPNHSCAWEPYTGPTAVSSAGGVPLATMPMWPGLRVPARPRIDVWSPRSGLLFSVN